MKRKTLWLILLGTFALLVRIALLLFVIKFREHPDILRWKDWTRIAFLYGFADTYTTAHIQFGTLPNCMPPGTLYIQYIMYIIGIQISKIVLHITQMPSGSLQWLNGPLITALFRIPSLCCDFLVGGIIYLIVKKMTKSEVKSYLGMALFLFNPVILFNSAYKGQMDAIVNMFFIASLYFLFNKKILQSLILFLCSLYVKLSLIYFFPILWILWWKSMPGKRFIIYSTITILIGLCILLPISINPFSALVLFLRNNAIGEMANITAYAFNLWWMIFRPIAIPEGIHNAFSFSTMHLIGSPEDSTKYFGIPLFWYGITLFIILLLPILFQMTRKHISNISIVKNLFIIALIAFLVLPRMHERYMYPIFPLLTILAVQSRRYMIALVLLSLLNLMNIYIVWHPVAVQFFPYTVWGHRDFQWMLSFMTVVISFSLYMKVVLSSQKENPKK